MLAHPERAFCLSTRLKVNRRSPQVASQEKEHPYKVTGTCTRGETRDFQAWHDQDEIMTNGQIVKFAKPHKWLSMLGRDEGDVGEHD